MYILQILLLNKFILGNWILRATNDDKFKESLILIEKQKYQSLFDGYYFDFQTVQEPIK